MAAGADRDRTGELGGAVTRLAGALRHSAQDPASPLRQRLADGRHRSTIAYRRARREARALPSFLIIGAQKGGTTSLHEYLAEHPDVGSSAIKEVHYFTANAHRPLDWYRAHFPPQGRYREVFESTPYYLFHPACPQRIRRALPGVRLIILLREPVARAHSHHNHERALGFEQLDLTAALDREPARLAGEEERLLADERYHSHAHQHFSYAARGMYDVQVRRWLEQFPREQMLIMPSEELFGAPAQALHRVQRWLGLSEHTPASLDPRYARSYAPLRSDTRDALAARFADSSARLQELTGVSFPWA